MSKEEVMLSSDNSSFSDRCVHAFLTLGRTCTYIFRPHGW